jgi:uncharacterized membrane protein YdcZ (DUF606 family)
MALPVVVAVIVASYLLVDVFGWEGRPARRFVGTVLLLVVFAAVWAWRRGTRRSSGHEDAHRR